MSSISRATFDDDAPVNVGPGIRRHILPALFFILLVLAFNLPLVVNLGTHFIGRPFDDTVEALWQLSHVHQAIFETHTNPFYSPDVFYPQGWYTASGAQPPWYYVALSPLTALLGPLIAYNLATLATLMAGGFGVYWLSNKLTGKTVAAITAGCAYITAPIFALSMGGFLNVLIGMMFLPYAVACTVVAMSYQGARLWRWALSAGVLLAATILGHWYNLFVATLPLIALALFVPSERRLQERLARLIAIGAISLIIIAPFALLTLHARREMLPDGAKFDLQSSEQGGISPDYLFSPNPFHPLWREQLSTIFPVASERDVVSPGITVWVLAIVGLVATPWRTTRPFVAMALVSLLLGLGPTLRWRGERVLLGAPARLIGVLEPILRDIPRPVGQIPILLPGLLLYRYLPFYSSMRAWSRFDIPFVLAVAVIVGFGSAWLLSKGRNGSLLAIALGILIVFEGLVIPYKHFTPLAVIERSVDGWLAAQPSGTAIIEYPRPWLDDTIMYSQSLHGQSIVNGYMSFQPDQLAAVDEKLGEWPNAAALPILREWGVDFVVVSAMPDNETFQNDIWPAVLSLDGLCSVASFADAYSFLGFGETYVFSVLEPGAVCSAERILP